MTGNKTKNKIALLMMIISFLLIFSNIVMAEENKVTLDISNTDLVVGNSVSMVITIDGTVNYDNISVQELDKFDVLSTAKSASTTIINGVRTNISTVNIELMPKTIGQYEIKAIVASGNDVYQSNTINVTISEKEELTDGEYEDVFIKTTISDSDIYFGEKVVLTYELYTNKNVSAYDFIEALVLDDFIVDEFSKEALTANYVDINGIQYIKFEAKKMILNPTSTGEFKIPASRFQVNVGSSGFYNNATPVYLTTDEVIINVSPVIVDNKPNDFSGIVGELNVEASYDKNEVNYGEPITLKVKLFGTGNLDLIEKLVKENTIPGFTVYETSKEFKEIIVNGNYSTEKEYELILVPQEVGILNVDVIKVSYFDTITSSYKNLQIPGTTISVLGEKQVGNSNLNSQIQEPILINQITVNQKNDDELVIRINKKVLLIIIGVFLASIIVTIIVLGIRKTSKKEFSIKELAANLNSVNEPNEIYKIYNQFFKKRFGLSLKTNSRSSIIKLVDSYGVANELIEIIDYMEHGRYYSNDKLEMIKGKMLSVVSIIEKSR